MSYANLMVMGFDNTDCKVFLIFVLVLGGNELIGALIFIDGEIVNPSNISIFKIADLRRLKQEQGEVLEKIKLEQEVLLEKFKQEQEEGLHEYRRKLEEEEREKLLDEIRDEMDIDDIKATAESLILNECKICFDAEKNSVLSPCGHCACCYECGIQMRDCPICRAQIKQVLRKYEC